MGRSEELGRLLAAVDRVARRDVVLVLVAGDAGVGKTRLLAELADRSRQRGARVLVGGCLEVGDVGLPYLPILEALHDLAADPDASELLAEVAESAPALARLLPTVAGQGAVGVRPGDVVDQLQLFEAVRTVVVRLAAQAPVLLILEDLHWADRSSRDLLAFLARTLRDVRIGLAASYRSDELHRRHPLRPVLAELVRLPVVERIQLASFSLAELAEHLDAVSGTPLPPDRVEHIHARCQGNPFYAEELLTAGGGRADVRLPPALADVLLTRVHVLSEPAQQVLRVVAVAGRRVSHWLLGRVTGRPEADLEDGLREAINAGVLVADRDSETYRFRHSLLQEAVEEDLLPGERVRLHARYARVLATEAEGAAAEVAYHTLACHDLVGALAASVRAADEAATVLAPAETLHHLTTALELWEQVPDPAAVTGVDRVVLNLRAAQAASAAGDQLQAIALAQVAAASTDPTVNPALAAEAHEHLQQHLHHAGRYEEALRAGGRAAELVPAQPPTPLRARVAASMAQTLAVATRRDEARRWCGEALAVARAVGSAAVEADVLVTLALVDVSDGKVADARSRLTMARARAAGAGSHEVEQRAVYNLAYLESGLGNLAAARALFDDGAELAERTGLGWAPFGLTMRREQCLVRYVAGEWDESERLAAGVPELVTTVAAARLAAAGLAVEVGRGRAVASRRLRHLAALAGVDPVLDMELAVREAELATWQDDLGQARSAIGRALAAIEGTDEADWAVHAAWVCPEALTVEAERAERARATGDQSTLTEAVAAGRALVEQARWGAERTMRADPGDKAHLLSCIARAEAEWTRLQGRSDPARWRAAAEAFSYGHVYKVACCQRRLAEALLGIGDREQATVAARAGHDTAVRLAAEPLRAALEGLARRGRLDLGTRVPGRSRAAGLTPRELEVLGLLVEGCSNQQIARRLYISGKTASVHVSNILAKLGVHSRLEAAARARELGLDRPAAGATRR